MIHVISEVSIGSAYPHAPDYFRLIKIGHNSVDVAKKSVFGPDDARAVHTVHAGSRELLFSDA